MSRDSTLRVSLPVVLLLLIGGAVGDSTALLALGIMILIPTLVLAFGGGKKMNPALLEMHSHGVPNNYRPDEPHRH